MGTLLHHGCMELEHVLIFAKDLNAMTTFYAAALGLTVCDSEPGFRRLENAGQVLVALHEIPSEVAKTVVIESPPKARSRSAIKPCFRVRDLEAIRMSVLQCGGQIVADRNWDDSRVLDCVDVEGNLFQLVANT